MGLKEIEGHRFSAAFLRQYEVFCTLGTGFSGSVVLAQQLALDRRVAIKLLDPHAQDRRILAKRFEREARLLSQLSHPTIIAVYDYGFDGNTPYLVEEYLEGENLQEHLLERAPLEPHRALSVAIAVARALAHSHRAGVLHRDVKPANVFLTDDGRTVLLDYGLAISDEYCTALTRPGYTVGTPLYMAPEQLMLSVVTPAADVYSVGMMLYQMVSNQLPFAGPGSDAYLAKLDEALPSLAQHSPTAPAALVELVDCCLARDGRARPADGTALLRRLRKLLPRSDTSQPVARERSPRTDQPSTLTGVALRLRTGLIAAGTAMVVIVFLLLVSRFDWSIISAPSLVRELVVAGRWPTELRLQLRAVPKCRTTVTVSHGQHTVAKVTELIGEQGRVLSLIVPANTQLKVVALFADHPRPTTVVQEVQTPPPTAMVLLDRFHLEREKDVPRRVAIAYATGTLNLATMPCAWADRVVIPTERRGAFCWSLAEQRVLWHNPDWPDLVVLRCSAERLYGYDKQGWTMAMSWDDGAILWRRQLHGNIDRDPIAHGTLFILRRRDRKGAIIALEGRDGSIRWQHEDERFTQPWSVSADNTVFVPEVLGPVHCYAVEDGQRLPTPALFSSSRLSTPVVSAAGKLFAGQDTGRIVAGRYDGPRLFMTRVIGEPRDLICVGETLYALCSAPPHLVALSAEDGTIQWDYRFERPTAVQFRQVAGRLFIHELSREVVNHLQVIDRYRGGLLTRFPLTAHQTFPNIIVSEGIVLINKQCDMSLLRLFGKNS